MHEAPIPRWITWSSRGACVLLALAVLIYPLLPAEWFLARDSATGEVFTFNKSHTTRVPFQFLWALEGFRRVPDLVRGLGFGVLLGLMVVPWRGAIFATRGGRRSHLESSQDARSPRSLWLVTVGGLVAVGVFYLLRVPYAVNAGFADAPILPGEVELGTTYAADALTYYVFHAVRGALSLIVPEPSGLLAITWTSCLAGGVFVAAMVVLARAAARTSAARLTLFLGGTLAGYTVMFCGYVETTQVELATMALYFAAAARTLRTPPGSLRVKWLALALAALSLALMAHAGGLLLVPSAIILLLGDLSGPETPWWRALGTRRALRNAALVAALVVLPFILVVVVPFYAHGDFGNITGGGDGIMFVSWSHNDASPQSRYTYYSFLSGRHLADLLSAMLIAAPLALPLGVCGGALWWRRRQHVRREDRWWLALLATAGGGCFLIPLAWNHDFGMWGDWNLAACYLFPLNLLAWSLFGGAVSGPGTARRDVLLATPALLVQLALAAGLRVQLI